MFVLKSAFWLTVGFLLVAPHGVNLGAQASTMKDQAIAAGMQAGEQLIVGQIFANATTQTAALPAPAVAAPSAALPLRDTAAPDFVFPRQRPAALG